MAFTLVHASGNMFARTSARRGVISYASAHGDVYTTGEAQKDTAYLRARPGFDEAVSGELAIGWKHDQFHKVTSGSEQVMVGGRRGPLRIAGRFVPKKLRRARRGPSRRVLVAVLTEIETGQRVIMATHHAIAKADSSNPWRLTLRGQGLRAAIKFVKTYQARYPDADVIFTGDLNATGRLAAFRNSGLTEARTPATFGRRRYDRIFRRGAKITNIHTGRTPGDHKALIATVTLSGETA